jgi:hypothetical protein
LKDLGFFVFKFDTASLLKKSAGFIWVFLRGEKRYPKSSRIGLGMRPDAVGLLL